MEHQTVSQAYYMEILKWLREAVPTNRPGLWSNGWILHHDDVPAHETLSVKDFLAQKPITETQLPPSSPDLVPNDWLFPRIKSALNGRSFQVIEDILKNVTTALKALPRQVFQKCFQQC
jgi:transposase